MRFVTLYLVAVCAVLLTTGSVQAQAFRPLPMPAPPAGRGIDLPIYLPWCAGDQPMLGILVVGGAGLAIGWALGQCLHGDSAGASSDPKLATTAWLVPPPDFVLGPDAVQNKARETTGLLEMFARRDRAFDPPELRRVIAATFQQVQKSWQERDSGPLRELLTPALLTRFEELVGTMRRNRVINRIDDLRLTRLEFVHVACPPQADLHEVTVLLTFVARVYYVDENTGAFQYRSRQQRLYQEFWVFRQVGMSWRLHAIERSHQSSRLGAPNSANDITTAT